jgi:hypothetical protein
MESKLYCYPDYKAAREAFNQTVSMLEGAAELGVTVTANWTVLEIRYVSEWSNQDILFKFVYVPIKVSVDMERLRGFRGNIHLFPLLKELHRQVEEATAHMYTFAAMAEERDGSKDKGATETSKPTVEIV